MGTYIPATPNDRDKMLKAVGRRSVDELFAPVPSQMLLKELKIPSGMSELEAFRTMEGLAGKNTVFKTVFRGAGAYRHYIPAAVKRITANETFITAYTPYQAEISQGILQSIFEYQTMICELTGMDVANASVYDGGSAAAEAVNMARSRNRDTVYVSEGTNPQVLDTIRTYCFGYGIPVKTVSLEKGVTDIAALKKALGADAACFYLQQPNYFGLLEDAVAAAQAVHAAGALLIEGVNPISLGILESPGACGADIAVGEGQPLGMPLAFGGPYLGFMACKAPLMRKMPGRIVGATTDAAGRRAFVLTLQAREQHIRREKASSNLCSNEAHCALTAAVYLSVMGAGGLAEAARQSHAKAVYAAKQISSVKGCEPVYGGAFFNEFLTRCPDVGAALGALEKEGILGGLPVRNLPEGGHALLWAFTELNTKTEIDRLVHILKETNGR
ncbi:MAG: aminomethyl-transferring glycine dehydrogenase subunit GcvPA [Spirochaetaceae bacterium]|jgi:glycine dehydrogenase subunit 1|nr:aminomethyl-transferring glycine dehydrogenase subunit GcvPA [Spirochaetaceae bacterium]